MGLWYGAEVITHHDGEEFEATYDSCVVLHLAEVTNEVSSHSNKVHSFDLVMFLHIEKIPNL